MALRKRKFDPRYWANSADHQTYYADEIAAGRVPVVEASNGLDYRPNTVAEITAATSGAVTAVDLTADPASQSGSLAHNWVRTDFGDLVHNAAGQTRGQVLAAAVTAAFPVDHYPLGTTLSIINIQAVPGESAQVILGEVI